MYSNDTNCRHSSQRAKSSYQNIYLVAHSYIGAKKKQHGCLLSLVKYSKLIYLYKRAV